MRNFAVLPIYWADGNFRRVCAAAAAAFFLFFILGCVFYLLLITHLLSFPPFSHYTNIETSAARASVLQNANESIVIIDVTLSNWTVCTVIFDDFAHSHTQLIGIEKHFLRLFNIQLVFFDKIDL